LPFAVDGIRLGLSESVKNRDTTGKSTTTVGTLITSLFSSVDTYLSEGETHLAAARRTVEQWFDEAMEGHVAGISVLPNSG